MERHEEDGLIELGTASVDTQGLPGYHMESGGLWTKTGISAD